MECVRSEQNLVAFIIARNFMTLVCVGVVVGVQYERKFNKRIWHSCKDEALFGIVCDKMCWIEVNASFGWEI